MANNLIQNPIGLSAVIQRIQKTLYDSLTSKWVGELQGFGEVYLNKKSNTFYPEAFTGGNDKTDYSGNLLTSDDSKFFFIPSGNSKAVGNGDYFSTTIDVCFIIDLSKAYPDEQHRTVSKSKAHNEVEKTLAQISLFSAKVESFTEGIKNLFSGLSFDAEKIDLQPKHSFKFTIRVIYSMNQQEC